MKRAICYISVCILVVVVLTILCTDSVSAGETVTVSGTVLLEEKPVAGAGIYFLSRDYYDSDTSEAEKIAETNSDGLFSVPITGDIENPMKTTCIAAYHPDRALGWITLTGGEDREHLTITLAELKPVKGMVKDDSGNPIPGAEIRVRYLAEMSGEIMYARRITMNGTLPGMVVKTGGDGGFDIRIPGNTSAVLLASGKGYTNAIQTGIQSGADNVQFTLEREGRIEGTVMFGDSGKPARDVRVLALSQDFKKRTSYGDAVTDENGRYSIGHCTSGVHIVMVSPGEKDTGWTADPRDDVDVKKGETLTGIDLTLIRGGIVTGRITNKDTGEPISGVSLRLTLKDGSISFGSAISGDDGVYHLRSIPGEMMLSLSSPQGYIRDYQRKMLTVADGETIDNVDFQFLQGIALTGTVRMFDGKPVGGARITGNTGRQFSGDVSAKSDFKGNFTLSGLKEGDKLTIKADQSDMKLESTVEIEVKPDTEIEILLEEYKTVTIEGIIVDAEDNPVAGISVKLMRMEGSMGYSTVVATSGKDGRFAISNLKIGNQFQVLAQNDQVRSDTFIAKETMEPFRLVLPKAERWLEGTVKEKDGKPIPGVRVIVNGGPSGFKEVTTDGQGHYRLDGLVAQAEEISLSHGEYGWYQFKYVLTNQPRDFVLLRGDRYLAGKVTDPEGKPLSGVSVRVESSGDQDPSRPSFTSTQTDNEGKFRLDGLFDDTETISISHNDYGYKRFENEKTNRDNAVFVLEKTTALALKTAEDRKQELLSKQGDKKVTVPPPLPGPLVTVQIKGTLSIAIDGDLSEWNALKLEKVPVEQGDPVINAKYTDSSFDNNPSKDDLSAEFRCFADEHTFYFGITVTDDVLKFGLNEYGVPFWDDCMEILFHDDIDTFSEGGQIFGDGQIWITAERDSTVKFEGKDPVTTTERIPCIWDALGARAALKQCTGGYTVEIAVPLEVLIYSGWDEDRVRGMNIRVYDRDTDRKYIAGIESMVEWAANPDEHYGTVEFRESKVRGRGKLPAKPEYRDALISALEHYKNGEWTEAEEQLLTCGDAACLKPFRAMVLQRTGKKDERLKTLVDLTGAAPYSSVAEWALREIYYEAVGIGRSGDYTKAAGLLENISNRAAKNALYYRMRLELARDYFQDGRYEKAKQVIDTLLATEELAEFDADSRIRNDARQLLSAVQQAMGKK